MSLGRGRTGGREKDSHRRRENGETGGFQGSLGSCFCPGQCLPSALSKCLGTEQSSSLDLEVGPEASSEPHGAWVLYVKRHWGFKSGEH